MIFKPGQRLDGKLSPYSDQMVANSAVLPRFHRLLVSMSKDIWADEKVRVENRIAVWHFIVHCCSIFGVTYAEGLMLIAVLVLPEWYITQ